MTVINGQKTSERIRADGKFFTFGTSNNVKREVKSNQFCCEDAGMAVDA